MFEVKSKSDSRVKYVFVSGKVFKGQGNLEDTLVLGSNSPAEDREFLGLKNMVRDFANPELKMAYDVSYGTFARFLSRQGINVAEYSLHKVVI